MAQCNPGNTLQEHGKFVHRHTHPERHIHGQLHDSTSTQDERETQHVKEIRHSCPFLYDT